jgi:hypothetical protein
MRDFSQRGKIHPTILLKGTKSDLICIKVKDNEHIVKSIDYIKISSN